MCGKATDPNGFGIRLTDSFVMDDPSETECDPRMLPVIEATYELSINGTACVSQVSLCKCDDIFSLGCDKNLGVSLCIYTAGCSGEDTHLGELLTIYETGDLMDDSYSEVISELLRHIHSDFYYSNYFRR